MRDREFEQWLIQGYRTASGDAITAATCNSRLSNCKNLERHEGDLDAHFAADRLQDLLGRMNYSKEDEKEGLSARHRVPINGNVYNGTATLRSALNLYLQFCQEWPTGANSPALLVRPQGEVVRPARQSSKWPDWNLPTDTAVLQLARLVAPFTHFLRPEIVFALVEDNERHRVVWAEMLSERGIDPSVYLWARGACAFPGVRRHSGSKEIAQHRRQTATLETNYSQALKVDDNNYPKHLWSFVFRGKPFQNFGPEGYALAHLIDHKKTARFGDEVVTAGTSQEQVSLPGLYTSAANSVYSPSTLIRPTDFAGPLRNLLQRRAAFLYGSFCNLLPPGLRISAAASVDWALEAFNWADPVGSLDNVGLFFAFRNQTINDLLASKRIP